MIIHVVKEGETISSIANNYNVLTERLIIDNGIHTPDILAVGQAIVILYPLITYTIQEGDTLASIAQSYQVSILQLLRNNPYLSERGYLVPGETIVITYETNIKGKLSTGGYVYPFVNETTLRTTLPFLTYLTVFSYQITEEGELIDIDDSKIIRIAKEYGVAPMMMVSTINEKGIGNEYTAQALFHSEALQDRLIDNIMHTLKTKGYYGLNAFLQFISVENQTRYEAFIQRLGTILHEEGFRFVVTITPKVNIVSTEIQHDRMNFSKIAESADALLLLTFQWGSSVGPPVPVIPTNILEGMIKNSLLTIPAYNLLVGYPVIAYDWVLPYLPGVTGARSMTGEDAVQLAAESGSVIQYIPAVGSSFFIYNEYNGPLHLVWFEDARSIDATIAIVPEYGLQGVSIWTTMEFFDQFWLVLNAQYEIERVENIDYFT